ncbi:hypothetical protein AWB68_08421 [Caballeronia choica]|uniref:Lipoprotein n=1 Tax=Caballeronia choica TaxID=326476 RepID=A0A158L269_9BURK|nr:hypothetical protein [Caballeronia choica]SAL87487.1 hypothetical protein AWB68_08421 [Caballeronia choica]
MPTSATDAVKRVLAASLIAMVMAPDIALAVDEVDDTVYVPNPKYDWAARVRQTTVAEGETITLVVHSTRDCIFCACWEGPLAGEGRFESWSKAHPGTRLIVVERSAISSNETPEDYPQELHWLAKRYEKDQRLRPTTPTFEIFVAQNLVFRSRGLYSWEDKAFPAIKDLDGRRSHSSGNAE